MKSNDGEYRNGVYVKLNEVMEMDCLDGMRQMPDNCIDLVVTSPPYNIDIDYGLYNDSKDKQEYKKFCKDVYKELYRLIKPKGLVAINVGNQRNSGLPHFTYFWLQQCGFKIIKEIFWYKGLYYIQGETIFVCSKTDDYHKYYGMNDGFFANNQFSTVWEMRYPPGESKEKLGHNAFFVKKMPENFIKINTKPGDWVLDPFMGVWTTAVAAKELKRNYIGFEINPEYNKLGQERIKRASVKMEQKRLF